MVGDGTLQKRGSHVDSLQAAVGGRARLARQVHLTSVTRESGMSALASASSVRYAPADPGPPATAMRAPASCEREAM